MPEWKQELMNRLAPLKLEPGVNQSAASGPLVPAQLEVIGITNDTRQIWVWQPDEIWLRCARSDHRPNRSYRSYSFGG
jgi:hypothetical protein